MNIQQDAEVHKFLSRFPFSSKTSWSNNLPRALIQYAAEWGSRGGLVLSGKMHLQFVTSAASVQVVIHEISCSALAAGCDCEKLSRSLFFVGVIMLLVESCWRGIICLLGKGCEQGICCELNHSLHMWWLIFCTFIHVSGVVRSAYGMCQVMIHSYGPVGKGIWSGSCSIQLYRLFTVPHIAYVHIYCTYSRRFPWIFLHCAVL